MRKHPVSWLQRLRGATLTRVATPLDYPVHERAQTSEPDLSLSSEAGVSRAEGIPDRTLVTAPPRVGVGDALRQFHPIFLIPVVLLVAISIAGGLTRSPSYTAESRVAISRVNLAAPGALAGFESATRSLASLYSLAVHATSVVRAITAETGVPRQRVLAQVNATPFPQTAVIRVIATAPSSSEATQLANAGARAIVAYSAGVVGPNSTAEKMLHDYELALRAHDAARRRRDLAVVALRRQPGAVNQNRADAAEARAEAARLRVDSVRAAYSSLATPGSSPLASILTLAEKGTSDRRSKLELMIFISVIAGGLIGASMAIARANALARRSQVVSM